MIINKILNNNAVITCNEQGKEIVAMGKGIAFQKKKGDCIDDTTVNKVYKLSNGKIMNDLENMISSIPIEYVSITYDIVDLVKKQYKKKLNDTIYVSLMDHIYSAAQRLKLGICLNNAMLWDIKQFHHEEFEIGIKALDLIEKVLHIEMPIDEAGFIALHLVEAQLDCTEPIVNKITVLMDEICNIVRYHFTIEFDKNSVYFFRFITHIKFFAQRLFTNKQLKNKIENKELLTMIKSKYGKSYKCVVKIKQFILQKYYYSLTEEEQLYLTIHIQRIVDELKEHLQE